DGESTELREQLSIERERRATLEGEIQRLTAAGDPEERFLDVWKALQSARAEILVLSNQLSEERHSREDLEIAVARMSQEGGLPQEKDFAEKLLATMRERRAEADSLAGQLNNA